MELWIRSTNGKNLTKCDCISIIDGKEIYDKYNWEYDGYTICQCYGNNPTKSITPLGTYKTKERALKVLDEIQETLMLCIKSNGNEHLVGTSCYVYEMPKE